jgi:hypothetical protein
MALNLNNLHSILTMSDRIWGEIPMFLDPEDDRSFIEQINAQYQGGWRPVEGFERDGLRIKHADEKPLTPLSIKPWNDDRVCIYERGWVAVFRPDGSFEVCRMD